MKNFQHISGQLDPAAQEAASGIYAYLMKITPAAMTAKIGKSDVVRAALVAYYKQLKDAKLISFAL